jgi:hypothetical protein
MHCSTAKCVPAQGQTLYGLEWGPEYDALQIELTCIKWHFEGWKSDVPLWRHYRNAFSAAWPEDDHHRWSDLCLQRIVERDITILLGPADSSKTDVMSKFVDIDWWALPEKTLWLVSSTELRGAELRIWGRIKQLFNRARARFPWLPGSVLESYHCITTDEISEDQSEGRLMSKGIIFVPLKRGGQWIGLGPLIGIKPPPGGRMGHAGDEIQALIRSCLDAYSNWFGKANFKGVMAANPATPEDPAGVAAEPLCGWAAWQDTGKTQEWTSKFYDAHVINLDGRDSPNFDFPPDKPTQYPYLVGRKKMDAVKKMYGEYDWHWWNQCVGKMRPGAGANRIIPIALCEEGGAFGDVVWKGGGITDIVGLDAAYGGIGGDRCVLQHVKYGLDVEGNNVISCLPPVIVPVSVLKKEMKPEDQIATFCADYCKSRNIPASNFFFDGRGTLAISLARLFDPAVNAVEFGGPATERPISQDIFVWDGDSRTKRLKTCREEYSKFISELWFRVALIIQCKQLRNLSREVADEGSKREWRLVKGPRMEAETKAEMKERTQWSPDLMDALAICCEGAVRKGFLISKLKDVNQDGESRTKWLADWAKKNREMYASKQLARR